MGTKPSVKLSVVLNPRKLIIIPLSTWKLKPRGSLDWVLPIYLFYKGSKRPQVIPIAQVSRVVHSTGLRIKPHTIDRLIYSVNVTAAALARAKSGQAQALLELAQADIEGVLFLPMGACFGYPGIHSGFVTTRPYIVA
jgi:hypothetical protein